MEDDFYTAASKMQAYIWGEIDKGRKPAGISVAINTANNYLNIPYRLVYFHEPVGRFKDIRDNRSVMMYFEGSPDAAV